MLQPSARLNYLLSAPVGSMKTHIYIIYIAGWLAAGTAFWRRRHSAAMKSKRERERHFRLCVTRSLLLLPQCRCDILLFAAAELEIGVSRPGCCWFFASLPRESRGWEWTGKGALEHIDYWSRENAKKCWKIFLGDAQIWCLKKGRFFLFDPFVLKAKNWIQFHIEGHFLNII